jgi:para-nitrobenzyl esterase
MGSDAEAGEVVGSEDCLYLNIFAPALSAADRESPHRRLPVMVWIHGGGNSIGSAHVYDGSALAVQEQIIVVTIHYRLGVFGWFSHPALRPAGSSMADASANFATLDMVRALTWVRDEIAVFGGNPRRVTIFGESAGGTNVLSLLIAPPARDLFQGAIAQSGGLFTFSRALAENYTDDGEAGHPRSSGEVILDLLVADERASGRAEAKAELAAMAPAEVSAYLRSKTPGEILAHFDGEGMGGMYRSAEIIRDGSVIPLGEPLAVLRSGIFNRVPVMLGTNRDEVKLFALMGSDHVTRVFGIPLWLSDERAYQLETEFPSRMWKLRGVDGPARAMAPALRGRLFAYRFDWDEERQLLFADLSKMLGAGHAVEIPFVFGGLSLGGMDRFFFDSDRRPAADALSRAMMSYWAEFARSGDPGRGTDGSLPLWRPWDFSLANGLKMMVLDTPADGGLHMSAESVTREGVLAEIATDPRFRDVEERCAVYRSLAERSRDVSREEYAALLDGGCAAYPLPDRVRD